MTIGFLFWLIVVLWFLFGLYSHRTALTATPDFGLIGGNLMLFILLFLLGWKVFGFVIQGG